MNRANFLRTLIALPFAAKVAIESKVLAPVAPTLSPAMAANFESMLEGARIGAGNYLFAKPRALGVSHVMRIMQQDRIQRFSIILKV